MTETPTEGTELDTDALPAEGEYAEDETTEEGTETAAESTEDGDDGNDG